SSRLAGTRSCSPATVFTPACRRPNSPPKATSGRLPQPPRQRGSPSRESAEPLGAPDRAQRSSAPPPVLVHPALYPFCLPDQSLDCRRRRDPAPAARFRAVFHPRLLARPAVDDPDGMAAAGADAHVDLGAS